MTGDLLVEMLRLAAPAERKRVAERLADKVRKLRIFPDAEGKLTAVELGDERAAQLRRQVLRLAQH